MTFDITKEEKRCQLNFFTNVILSEKASTGNIGAYPAHSKRVGGSLTIICILEKKGGRKCHESRIL